MIVVDASVAHGLMRRFGNCCLVLAGICLGSHGGLSCAAGVQPRAPVITWPAPAPIVYGTPLGDAQLNATANVAGNFTYRPVAGTVLPAGTHSLFASFHPSVAGYTDALVSSRLAVNRAALAVTAENQSRPYGERNPAFTYRFKGFRNRENATALLAAPVCKTTATRKSRPGTYPITCSGAKALNYTLKYVDGVLTVTKARPR